MDLDRTKHVFDVLEHVLGGVHTVAEEDEVGGLVAPGANRPVPFSDDDEEVRIPVH